MCHCPNGEINAAIISSLSRSQCSIALTQRRRQKLHALWGMRFAAAGVDFHCYLRITMWDARTKTGECCCALLSQMQLAAVSEFNKTDLSTHTHTWLCALTNTFASSPHNAQEFLSVERFGSGNSDNLGKPLSVGRAESSLSQRTIKMKNKK